MNFKNPKKVSNPEENWTKLLSKPSKNKKFKRNEHRRVPEMNENHPRKQSNETWKKKHKKKHKKKTFKNDRKWVIQMKIAQNCHKNRPKTRNLWEMSTEKSEK